MRRYAQLVVSTYRKKFSMVRPHPQGAMLTIQVESRRLMLGESLCKDRKKYRRNFVLRLKCNNATECNGYMAETIDLPGKRFNGQRSITLSAEKGKGQGRRPTGLFDLGGSFGSFEQKQLTIGTELCTWRA